ncbi:MAG: Fic family protein [Endomicrobium sp.]|jgi:Fic family protein|nr:Fic family protein [Endomicrobium sp.]
MRIEALKEIIKNLPITPGVMKTLRETARLQSTHYSTRIEGNRLTQKEVEQVIKNKESFTGRKRDELEIKGYYLALEWLENNVAQPLTETTIKTIHSLVEGGGRKQVTPTQYRDGQNVIKDSATGEIVYLPPESKDVAELMSELIAWIGDNKTELPCPISAAIAHYQFATIHPYYDGNGRTARLLATLVLYQGGYDLKGLFSLEEYYARDLQAYYNAISRGNHHNYYFGRADADITRWIEYFVSGMLDSFEHVKKRAEEAQTKGKTDKSKLMRALNPKQRQVLTLFEEQDIITSKDIETLFSFSARSARLLCSAFIKEGFLQAASSANRNRTYRLAEKYKVLIG